MSSHHFVREKQEPALLIISLTNFDNEHLGQLLEWNPTVFVSDNVYAQADNMGIKIDGILTNNPNVKVQSHTKVILSENPVEDGLKYFAGESYHALNIINDEFNMKDYVLYIQFINLVVFVNNRKIHAISSGFSKWKAAGEKVMLLQEIQDLQISNLHHVTKEEWEVKKDGFFSLCFNQPFVFIAEEL